MAKTLKETLKAVVKTSDPHRAKELALRNAPKGQDVIQLDPPLKGSVVNTVTIL